MLTIRVDQNISLFRKESLIFQSFKSIGIEQSHDSKHYLEMKLTTLV